MRKCANLYATTNTSVLLLEDAARGAGPKKETFASQLYNHWMENKSVEDRETRSEIAVYGRWKKISTLTVTSSPLIFLAAWKWTSKLTSEASAREKRKTDEDADIIRPEGHKAAKKKLHRTFERPAIGDTAHHRFVAAAEMKANMMEQQLQVSIFMQDPLCDESKVFFALQRKVIPDQLWKKAASAMDVRVASEDGLDQHGPSHGAVSESNNEYQTNENTEGLTQPLV
ncbi:hypothetical protein PHMEG_00016727 [Phytophthora megakarya]|uniref:Uncharacterized protein n=1 Tax=Phytophthora megakarya TaxID=4795 RepID=A0A225W0P3_9STRA|nr:hypothetical protein PHMEG_00016727 [Phytophthora megakarya]